MSTTSSTTGSAAPLNTNINANANDNNNAAPAPTTPTFNTVYTKTVNVKKVPFDGTEALRSHYSLMSLSA
jgi:hypothetical protein